MKIYLVGGAVRDKLLGLSVKERDWVVIGATVDDMLRAGFRQVGKDFPVFLHPETGEEYALARTERKIGLGYAGFEFNASPWVTLVEDLKRRDLTINAMAETPAGDIIDPWQGQEDLAKKTLRHVSPAFAEDPVRILRAARFAARFGFEVAPETLGLMRSMVTQGEVNALVAERVWKELERGLSEPYPEKFFAVLAVCGALAVLFPSLTFPAAGISVLAKVPNSSTLVRFAVLLYALSENEIKQLCDCYRVPSEYRELAMLVARYGAQYQRAKELTAEELLTVLLATDAFRRFTRFKDFLLACEICSLHSSSSYLLSCHNAAKMIDIKELTTLRGGQEIAKQVKQKRLRAIQLWLENR
jgi:tRNA nucleotidyltransferase (CCA-adding enzyme)